MLIGVIDNNDENLFEIVEGVDIWIVKLGEFCFFVNDLNCFYGVNVGCIKFCVMCLG